MAGHRNFRELQEPIDSDPERRARVDHLIKLMDEWMEDESGYDEETWPALKAYLEEEE